MKRHQTEDQRQNAASDGTETDAELTQDCSPDVHGRDCYVYFIRDDDGAIKIGHSISPEVRLGGLQVGSSRPLFLIGSIDGGEQLESELHKKFDHLKIHGEWFHAEPELEAFIDEVLGLEPTPVIEPPKPPLSADAKVMIARLINIRAEHDAESAIGYCCSNLAEQIEQLAEYERPEWATDERQALPWLMKQQMQRLERLLRN